MVKILFYLFDIVFHLSLFIEEIEVELQSGRDLGDLGLEVKIVQNQVDIEEADQEKDEEVVQDLKNVIDEIG